MNTVFFNEISEIADLDREHLDRPIITRDNAMLVTMTTTGPNPQAVINKIYQDLLMLITPDLLGKTLYMSRGSLTKSETEYKYSVVLGISGVQDLQFKLMELNPKPEPVPIAILEPSVEPEPESALAPEIPELAPAPETAQE